MVSESRNRSHKIKTEKRSLDLTTRKSLATSARVSAEECRHRLTDTG